MCDYSQARDGDYFVIENIQFHHHEDNKLYDIADMWNMPVKRIKEDNIRESQMNEERKLKGEETRRVQEEEVKKEEEEILKEQEERILSKTQTQEKKE